MSKFFKAAPFILIALSAFAVPVIPRPCTVAVGPSQRSAKRDMLRRMR